MLIPEPQKVSGMGRVTLPGMGLLLAGLLNGCATALDPVCPVVAPEKPQAVTNDPDRMVQVLQRRIQEREKRIAELTSTLEALKHIDNDVRAKKKIPPIVQDSPR